MPRLRLRSLPLRVALVLLLVTPAAASTELERCLGVQGLLRLARVLGPDGRALHARVVAEEDGVPSALAPIGAATRDLAAAFARAAHPREGVVWKIPAPERSERICAPFSLPLEDLDGERRVVVAAGLNYAAHADEAGGGDVFLFPKPVVPGGPYRAVTPPAGTTLFDYEVELGFVLLEDVDLGALPTREELLARSAFFVANDLTDREPIIRHATLSGPGTGFVEAKGQPGFLPAGPWLVRGSDLFAALTACGRTGLGLRLEVDEGEGFRMRQAANTSAMILEPRALLARIAQEVASGGLRSPMPVRRASGPRHYPLAVEAGGRRLLPAGSVILTGTPEGVALQAPSPVAVLARGLLRLRGPFEQFRQEQLARAAAGEPGGYLGAGDRVRARIDGLGSQIFRIATAGDAAAHDPCEAERP